MPLVLVTPRCARARRSPSLSLIGPLSVRRAQRLVQRLVQRRVQRRVQRLVLVLLVLAVLIPAGATSAQDGASSATSGISVQRVRPGIHVASGYANGNVLVVESDTGLLLVDAQSATRVAALDSAIRRLSSRPVRLVVNTHYHGDHTEGNAFFRQLGAEVVAQRNVAVQAVKDTVITDWSNWHRTPLAAGALPNRAFDDSIVFDFGREGVHVWHAPGAHTDGDAMIWLPRANVLHIGDIFEVGAPPFIDLWAGGSVAGMLAAIDRVLAVVDERTVIVPGHGAVSSREELVRYRAMLQTVRDRVAAAQSRGKTLDALLAERPAREWESTMGGPRRAQQFVTLVYADLSQDGSNRTPVPRPPSPVYLRRR